jgi:hypothetical protein
LSWLLWSTLIGFALSGCALQADVMELGTNMEEVEGLQRKLETQLEDAEEAIESVHAMRVRMETVEEKLSEGVSPELEARINVGLKTMERALRQLADERSRTGDRLDEAETFFIGEVKRVSARQKRSEDGVAAMEARLGSALSAQSSGRSPATASAPGDDPYLQWLDERLSGLSDHVRELRRVQEETTQPAPEEEKILLDPRVEELSKSVATLQAQLAEKADAQGVGPDGETLEKRISALESQGISDANEAVQRRMDQIAEATDVRLSQMTEQQLAQAQPLLEVKQHQARQDQVLTLLDQRFQELSSNMAGTAGPTAALMVKLAQRVDAMEAATTTELQGLQTSMRRVEAGGVGRSPGETAALAGLSGQMELLAASLDERIMRLEQGNQVAPVVSGDSQLYDRIATMEPVLTRLDDRLLAAEQAQMADMTELREQLAKLSIAAARSPQSGAVPSGETVARLERQEQLIANLERRLAALQTDPQVAFLTDRFETLSSSLGQRLDSLEQGTGSAPVRGGDPAGIASLSGQVSLLEASLTDRMERLEKQASQAPREVSQADPELAGKLLRQEEALSRLAQRVAALQEDPKNAFLAEQVERVASDLNERMAELSEQVEETQSRQTSQMGPDPAAMAGLSGQMALLEANLGSRMGRLEKGVRTQQAAAKSAAADDGIDKLIKRFDALSDRIGGLEQAQMKDLDDLRQQVRRLSEALSRQRDEATP